MSKSRGNVITPGQTTSSATARRGGMYLLFIGPVDQDAEWQDSGFEGIVRFLHRLWRVVLEHASRSRPRGCFRRRRWPGRRTRRSRR